MIRLFRPPLCERIQRILPLLFDMAEKENRRGHTVGMEVGNTRERILIALLYYVFDQEEIRLPPTTSSEVDVFVQGCPISIKTKTGVTHSGIKLKWTVDWIAIQAFLDSFEIVSNLLYVNINWSDVGGFYYIPVTVQHHAVNDLGIKNYVKTPKQGTNPRGVEISSQGMKYLITHRDTKYLSIRWERKDDMDNEKLAYKRWIELWEKL